MLFHPCDDGTKALNVSICSSFVRKKQTIDARVCIYASVYEEKAILRIYAFPNSGAPALIIEPHKAGNRDAISLIGRRHFVQSGRNFTGSCKESRRHEAPMWPNPRHDASVASRSDGTVRLMTEIVKTEEEL